MKSGAEDSNGEAPRNLQLEHLLTSVLGDVEIAAVTPVTAGASKTIDIIETVPSEGGGDVSRAVLRAEPLPQADPNGMMREAALLKEAAQRGVPVPRVLAAGRGGDDYSVPFVLTTFVDGESLAPRLLRRFAQEGGGDDFARELGGHLARIHSMEVPQLLDPAGTDEHADWHGRYRALGVESAAFEWAFRWLEENSPQDIGRTLVHGDFRLGNLMVDDGRVTGVLDWELAHVGDPREDLGWVSAPPWRFRSTQPVAGVGSRDALLQGYRDAGGTDIALEDLHWWEVLGTVKWGVMCLGRGREAADLDDRSLEFALIGRRFAECEYDVLRQLGWDSIEAGYATARRTVADAAVDTAAPGAATDATLPSAGEIEQTLTASFGSDYGSRLQGAALQMVLREARAGARMRAHDQELLAQAGHASEGDLAASIRSRSGADAQAVSLTDAERAAIEALVSTRLALANPTYLPRT